MSTDDTVCARCGKAGGNLADATVRWICDGKSWRKTEEDHPLWLCAGCCSGWCICENDGCEALIDQDTHGEGYLPGPDNGPYGPTPDCLCPECADRRGLEMRIPIIPEVKT